MARNTDFIGFTFNGCHSSEFNIYSVSDGSRYQDNLVPNPIDYTEQVPGGVGQYYFGSDIDIKEFPLSIAYDNLSELQVRELRNWLAPDAVGELIFDERPYKTYTAKISTSPNLSFICFDKYNSNTGKKERVYKGEGSINFVCYYPLGVVSGDKKQLGWYREQIDNRIYRSIGGSSSIIDYKLENNEIAIFEKIKGNTIEIGSGDKSPDNPYNIVGSNPTKATVCGKNLCPPTFYRGAYTHQAESRIRSEIIPIVPHVQYVFSVAAGYAALNVYFLGANKVGLGWLQSANNTAAQLRFTPNKDTYRYAVLVVSYPDQTTPIAPDAPISAQLEFGTAATPYTPYTGQTVPLPALAPLYGARTVCDEYDALSGIYTQRLKRVVLSGSETVTELPQFSNEDSHLFTIVGQGFEGQLDDYTAPSLCSHLPNTPSVSIYYMINGYELNPRGNNVYIRLRTDTGITDAAGVSGWLTAQAEAGTPVMFLFPLAEKIEESIIKVNKIALLNIKTFSDLEESNLIKNIDSEKINYFTDSNANLSLRIYSQKYRNIDEWSLSSGLLETLDAQNPVAGYDHYITLPDGSKGIQLFNPGDKETDFILSFNKPTPMNDIFFTLSNGEQFMLNLRSSDTDVEDYGAVSDAEKRIAAMTGGVITIDTKKNRIMYKYGTDENVTEESIYFALKKGQFFKIPKNKTSTGGYNLVIGTTSNIETDSIKISYDYLYY